MAKDTPYVGYGVGHPDYRALFYSDPEASLRLPITVSKGFGVLKEGQAMAFNTTATNGGGAGKMVPYDACAAALITGAEYAPGRAYLVADGAANTSAYVAMNDSYKFVVGDHVYAVDSDDSDVDCGAITAINRTTYPHMAVITVTNNVTVGITVAKFGYLYTKGADTCVGILEMAVDTGVGAAAADANATLVVSNAILYTGCLINLDATGLSDISGTQVGQFTVLK